MHTPPRCKMTGTVEGKSTLNEANCNAGPKPDPSKP